MRAGSIPFLPEHQQTCWLSYRKSLLWPSAWVPWADKREEALLGNAVLPREHRGLMGGSDAFAPCKPCLEKPLDMLLGKSFQSLCACCLLSRKYPQGKPCWGLEKWLWSQFHQMLKHVLNLHQGSDGLSESPKWPQRHSSG